MEALCIAFGVMAGVGVALWWDVRRTLAAERAAAREREAKRFRGWQLLRRIARELNDEIARGDVEFKRNTTDETP